MKSNKQLVILGTGGTIAGRSASASDNLGYTAAQLGVERLVADIPGLTGLHLQMEQVAQVDSKDMSTQVWQALLGRVVHHLAQEEVQGVVITHGTDTLEETAFFLHAVLAAGNLLDKPVVLTCAVRPASSLSPDGPQNLRDAIAVASDLEATGVMAVCSGIVHGAVAVQKVHSYRLDAFTSGDAGPVGVVEEGAVRWQYKSVPNNTQALIGYAMPAIKNVLLTPRWPRVEVVLNHAGTDGRMVDLLRLERIDQLNRCARDELEFDAVEGIVVAGTGNGTLHIALHAALLKAQAAGVRILRSSRCAYGRVLSSSLMHAENDFEAADGLSPVKTRILLALALLALPTQQEPV
jgi:L-asparaginase